MTRISKGFSLLEVLVAAFIMFISIAVFTSIYSGAMLSSDVASKNIQSANATSLVLDNIAFALKQRHHQDEASGEMFVFDTQFRWQARVVESARPQGRFFGAELIQPEHQAKRWQVSLQINDEAGTYTYEETTW